MRPFPYVPNPNSSAPAAHSHAGGAFATTHWSLVLHAGQGDDTMAQQALETLCRAYWPAIYAYLRRTGQPPEAAQDLTQEFFARVLEKGLIARADQQKGRFRSFLLTVLQRFLTDDHDRNSAQKRGGGRVPISLEDLTREEGRPFEPTGGRTPEQEFDRRWALAMVDNALARLQAEAERLGHQELFAALRGNLDGDAAHGTLVEVARRFGLEEGAVKMRLRRWRLRYGELIREEVAQTVPRVADLDTELRHLLAALSG
ncbi:MAG: sigma-70 family RNA polymerase sigma factor [Verrucomicrobiales bacterium]|nr:sigma-70 family RNA polymerase sigma factor [Verrucomicrobiales bacterium]